MGYDFSGWATRNDLLCTDGRTIRRNAFKENDGARVPLIWMHDHTNLDAVLGHADLENREEGVYAYCKFNDSENGKLAKHIVEHGDVKSLSIWANQLKQIGSDVIRGKIKELSLVLAGANSGAFIDSVMAHGDSGDEDGLIINYDEGGLLILSHSDEEDDEEEVSETEDTTESKEGEEEETPDTPTEESAISHSDEEKKLEDESQADKESDQSDQSEKGKTIKEIINTMNDDQKTAMHAIIGAIIEGDDAEEEEIKHSDEENEGGESVMKHNVFDKEETKKTNVLSHADQEAIIALAKQSSVGSLKQAMKIFAQEKQLAHSEDGVGVFEDYSVLFPELELLKKGEPDTIWANDQTWVGPALRKIHKSPFSRIRTRHADARLAELEAKGYQKKGNEKTKMGQIKMIKRETTPQTIYIKDSLHRDDIIDITDFSIVDYQWKIMRTVLDETMVLAAMIGDGRSDVDPDKISEDHIRPIWKDDEEYTIHQDVDIAAAKKELQGSNTSANFGENYIYAEAIITAALYSREKFKGTGTPDFYCTPHLVNVMLLARDLNGRRIYDSKADLAKALNCNSIVEVEQFEGLTRKDENEKEHKLLGLFVNLNDYTFGSTRGGEITKFEDFDMDFNLKKFMLETRLSGSLYKLKSAIALEEPVATDEVNG